MSVCSRPPFNVSALALALATVMPLSAMAQSTQPAKLDAVVVSATGYEQKITEAPASISVISAEELAEKSYSNLAEALSDVEGVDIGQGTGKTGGLNISIRGMPREYTLILIDGRRQNAAGNVTPNGFDETSTSFMPPLSAIERIEVIRGPMSTLYGSDAMGGVINIITKKVADEWAGSITLDHTFQENRDYGDAGKATFYTSGPLVNGLLGLQVRGSVYDREASDLMFDNDSAVSKRGPSPVEGRINTLGGRLTFTPHDDHDFSLDYERSRQVYNNDEGQLGNLDAKPDGRIYGYDDELRFERDQFALTHTGRLSFGTWDSSLMHNKTETIGRTIPGKNSGGDFGKPVPAVPSAIVGDDRELETTNLVFDTKLVAPVGDSHTLTVGGQWWKAEMTDGYAGEDFEQKTWALFAENEWLLRDDLALTLGARYDDHEAFGGHISPRSYLVWNANYNWTLKGGISKGYKTPSLNDLHDGVNGATGQGAVTTIGNPDLDPEESTNYEVGAYFDNLSGFNANVTLFYNEFKDKIANGDPVAHPLCAGNVDGTCTQKVNIDEAETYGLELAARWQFTPAWAISANYTYTDSEQKSGENKGLPLTNTPEHLANVKLDWQAADRLTLWLKGEYRGERARFTSKYENLSAENQALFDAVGDLDAYTVFHLGGTFRAAENVTFTAVIYNLFDKDFLKGEFYTDNTGSTQWASKYTQTAQGTTGTLEEGRRLWLSANISF